jgi:hypothetical protein
MQVSLLVENHNRRTRGRKEQDTAINQLSSCITIIITLSDNCALDPLPKIIRHGCSIKVPSKFK